jgi:hypothetical protein
MISDFFSSVTIVIKHSHSSFSFYYHPHAFTLEIMSASSEASDPHNPHGGHVPPAYSVKDLLRALADRQRHNQESVNGLAQTMMQLLQSQMQQQQQPLAPPPRATTTSSGPKVKEPRPYDRDRSNGKLDDHI